MFLPIIQAYILRIPFLDDVPGVRAYVVIPDYRAYHWPPGRGLRPGASVQSRLAVLSCRGTVAFFVESIVVRPRTSTLMLTCSHMYDLALTVYVLCI